VLIVEDDAELARTELEVARERGFKGIVALRGDSGLALAHEYKPDAIILDMKLPVMDGWTVLERLKQHPETRHIPVHIVSAGDGARTRCGRRGRVRREAGLEGGLEETFGAIRTFIDREVKRLLVVEDDERERRRSSS
jgi:CheY-like chemotaxis protein